ncbi:MAG: hypothetical protein ACK5QT_08675 [Oligoflexia bacterium]
MIYLAIHGKIFGPFNEGELTEETLSEYRWIFRSESPQLGWQPVDAMPTQVPQSPSRETEAVATVVAMPTAVAGKLAEVRARGGWLQSREHSIRLSIGTPIRLQLVQSPRALPARVERIETSPQGIRYLLSWEPAQAP